MMRAWRITGAHQPLTMSSVPEPTAGPGQLLISPRAVGLCRSDLGFMNGTLTRNLGTLPITLGHEIAGTIREVGVGVDGFAVGDRIAVRAGIETPGTATDGGFADLVVTDAALAVHIPDGVTFSQAAIATDAGLTAYHATVVEAEVSTDNRVGVIGLGGLGHIGAQIAVARGAQVWVVDPNAAALQETTGSGAYRAATDITEFTGADLDVIIDFAGYGTTTVGAMHAVRDRGTIVQVGLGVDLHPIPLATLVSKRIRLLGSLTGTNADLQALLQLIAQGIVEPHVTQIDFVDVADGYRRLAEEGVRGRLVAQLPD